MIDLYNITQRARVRATLGTLTPRSTLERPDSAQTLRAREEVRQGVCTKPLAPGPGRTPASLQNLHC